MNQIGLTLNLKQFINNVTDETKRYFESNVKCEDLEWTEDLTFVEYLGKVAIVMNSKKEKSSSINSNPVSTNAAIDHMPKHVAVPQPELESKKSQSPPCGKNFEKYISDKNACQIWAKCCYVNNNSKCYWHELWTELEFEFKKRAGVVNRTPKSKQLEQFFQHCGGKIDTLSITEYNSSNIENIQTSVIDINKFDKFWMWFKKMCLIVKDLRYIYDKKENDTQKIELFMSRDDTEKMLKLTPAGTFILRLSSSAGGLAISYKLAGKARAPILHLKLQRKGKEVYMVGKSKKEAYIADLIRSWIKLKYAWTEDQLYPKNILF